MTPRISREDFHQMEQVLIARNSKYGRYLHVLLTRYEQVEEHELGAKVVRLNSEVELWLGSLQKKVQFRIVLPTEADVKKRKLSVFAPVCLAVLGRSEGEQVETEKSGMKKIYRILTVKNAGR